MRLYRIFARDTSTVSRAFCFTTMLGRYLSLVKFSHTIFALPFALVGFFLGVRDTGGKMDWLTLVLILVCMVTARSAAMAFNRWADRDIDAANPRTVTREIPAGVIQANQALAFVILNCIVFIVCTWFINPLCFYLSPVALLVVLGYSYTKRFTALCHVILGLGLGLAPVGAYVAQTGRFDLTVVLYGSVVLFWVSGFDIMYALQDDEFDRSKGLHSIPEAFGRVGALRISIAFHCICAVLLVIAGSLSELQWLHWIAVAAFILLLIYQHLIIKPSDLSRIGLAFFTTNGVGSIVFGSLVIADIFLL